MKLPERLKTVAGFIETGASVADVGSDHGYLPVYLAINGQARRIIASDISAGSLAAARRNAAKYGVADMITFVVAPGLEGVSGSEVDTIVIAGVGGETIAGILGDAPWTRDGKRLILQPQTKKEKLLLFLSENGYVVREIKETRDRGRDYTVILAEGAGM